MRQIRHLLLVLIFFITLHATSEMVHAIPPLPSSYYGTVKKDGENLPEGTLIETMINGEMVAECPAQIYAGNSVYSIDIQGDDSETKTIDGGREGDTLQFRVGGVFAEETAVWHGGQNIELNLTISSPLTLNTPRPSNTPLPTQTPIVRSEDQGNEEISPTPSPDVNIQESEDEIPEDSPEQGDGDMILEPTNMTSGSELSSATFESSVTSQTAVKNTSNTSKSPQLLNLLLYSGIGILVIAGMVWLFIKK